jgi:hypothetical protein
MPVLYLAAVGLEQSKIEGLFDEMMEAGNKFLWEFYLLIYSQEGYGMAQHHPQRELTSSSLLKMHGQQTQSLVLRVKCVHFGTTVDHKHMTPRRPPLRKTMHDKDV